MHSHHFHALEKEMGMQGNSLEGFSTPEHFLDDIQLKRIDTGILVLMHYSPLKRNAQLHFH